MKFGIYSDPHTTKKIQGLENEWEESVIKSFEEMYRTFVDNGVDIVFCAGDFFDKAVLEARNVNLINKLINSTKGITTYVLLGNHEIDSNDHNILEVLSETESDLKPVTDLTELKDINVTMIPYSIDIESVDKSLIKGHIVFTHHDIYGSELAGGKVRASFGIDPNTFNDSIITFNGHIHLRSILGSVVNVGSLFSSQFAELRDGEKDHPMYYIYDTESRNLTSYNNLHSLHFITINEKDSEDILSYYDSLNINPIVRIIYNDKEQVDINDELLSKSLKVVYKKNVSISNNDNKDIKRSDTLDIRSLISSYLSNDETLTPESRERIQKKSFDILGG